LLQILSDLFKSITSSSAINASEVPLFLCLNLFQAIPAKLRESKQNNNYYELIKLILNIDFLQFNHRITTLMYIENIMKYSPYFMDEEGFVDKVIRIFFSEQAIRSKHASLAARSCYLCLKWCEKYVGRMIHQAPMIVNETISIIQKVESGEISYNLIGLDELIYLYTLIGLFVSYQKIDY
jgi:hypothetical protein